MNTLKRQLTTLFGLAAIAITVMLVTVVTAQAQDPGTTAFQQECAGSIPTVSNTDVFEELNYQVPANKRLVIERLSLSVFVPKDATLMEITMSTRILPDPSVSHFLPRPTLQFTDAFGGGHYVLSIAPDLYADGGQIINGGSIKIDVHLSAKNANEAQTVAFQASSTRATISGHLVCPGTVTCTTSLPGLSQSTTDDKTTTPANTDSTVISQTRPRFAKPTKSEAVAMLNSR
jgi:hypothetical protein